MPSTKVLRVIISGDAKGAQKAFAQTGKAAEDMGSKMHAAGKVAAAGIAAGGVAAAAFAVKSANTFANVGKEVLKLQRYTGTTAEQASRLRVAFKLTGVDAEGAGKALGIFSKNLDAGKLDGFNHSLAGQHATQKKVATATAALAKAQEHLSELHSKAKPNMAALAKATETVGNAQKKLTALQGTGGNAIGELGFKTRDATGHLLPMHELLLKTADVFEKMKAGPEKTALAMQLFGKSGKDLLPFLNKGAAGIAELEKQSDKFGTTLGTKDLEAVKESTKQHRLFSLGMEGLQIQIGRYVLPIMTKLVGFFADHLPGAIKTVRGVMASIGPAIVSFTKPILGFFAENPRAKFVALAAGVGLLAVAVLAALGPVTLTVGAIALLAAGVAYAYTHFKTFRTVVDGVRGWLVGTLVPAMQAVGAGIAAVWQMVADWTHKHWAAIQQIVGIAAAGIRNVISAAVTVVQTLWQTFGGTLIAMAQNAWNLIRGVIQGAINIVAGIVRTVMAVIRGDWGAAWNGVKQTVSGAWQVIKSYVQNGIGGVLAIVRLVGGAISLAWNGIWSGISGAVTSAWNGIVRGVQTGVNGVIGVINMVIGAIDSVTDALGLGKPISLIGSVHWVTSNKPASTYSGNGRGGSGRHAFASGGHVPGSGSGDTVAAMLTPGEFVVKKSVVEKPGMLEALRSINGTQSSDNRHFFLGGLVDGIKNLAGDFLATLREDAVKVAFAGPLVAANAAIGHLHEPFRGIADHFKNMIYNWAKGTNDDVNTRRQKAINDAAARNVGGAIGAALAGGNLGPISGGLIARIEAVIKSIESGGNYSARNNHSSAAGAYQFTGATWRGLGGSGSAADAPPAVQDAIAGRYIASILARNGGNVAAVPASWYVGSYNPNHLDYVPAGGNKLTVRQYIDMWMGRFARTAPVGGASSGHGHAFHTGGTFHAPTPGGQGWALLRDRETVSTPGSGGGGIHIHVAGSILSERDLVDVFVKAKRRGLLPAGV